MYNWGDLEKWQGRYHKIEETSICNFPPNILYWVICVLEQGLWPYLEYPAKHFSRAPAIKIQAHTWRHNFFLSGNSLVLLTRGCNESKCNDTCVSLNLGFCYNWSSELIGALQKRTSAMEELEIFIQVICTGSKASHARMQAENRCEGCKFELSCRFCSSR